MCYIFKLQIYLFLFKHKPFDDNKKRQRGFFMNV